MDTFTYLVNSRDFGCRIRCETAKAHLERFDAANERTRKMIMIRIFEEVMSSSEDLTIWTAAIRQRHSFPQKHKNKRWNDIWAFMLLCRAEDVSGDIAYVSRARTAAGLLKKFDMPSFELLAEHSVFDASDLEEGSLQVLKAIKNMKRNRSIRKGFIQRYYNKVKHGMQVVENGDKLLLRDLRERKIKGSKKRSRQQNIDVDLSVTKRAATEFTETIESNMQGVIGLISLHLAEWAYNLNKITSPSPREQQALITLKRLGVTSS